MPESGSNLICEKINEESLLQSSRMKRIHLQLHNLLEVNLKSAKTNVGDSPQSYDHLDEHGGFEFALVQEHRESDRFKLCVSDSHQEPHLLVATRWCEGGRKIIRGFEFRIRRPRQLKQEEGGSEIDFRVVRTSYYKNSLLAALMDFHWKFPKLKKSFGIFSCKTKPTEKRAIWMNVAVHFAFAHFVN